ncbi:MAG: nucleotidyltransferase domain-containing protein [Halobacteriales archaeon]|nr:nucleotidyltransferase domain-containing protein [Halobacteriales archaeon]
MPYSRHDTPEVVRRIESDLAAVQASLHKADPKARALVLTGGFARGEGTVLAGEPQNDYDLVVLRGVGAPRVPYARLRERLEARLGLHIDLAPVPVWRLRWARPSIFWYETALRGRTLWGEELLDRIPVRAPEALDPGEGLRLLVNRAAGLLLCTEEANTHKVRIQAAKALLAASDAHLLARSVFPPSQVERCELLERQLVEGKAPPAVVRRWPWHEWAYQFKVAPDHAPSRDARDAWQAAANAILDAVPTALRHAGHRTLASYAQHDGFVDHLVYYRRSRAIERARRLVRHPTGRVRVATLRLLAASLDGHIRPEAAQRCLGEFTPKPHPPVPVLDALRKATLQ